MFYVKIFILNIHCISDYFSNNSIWPLTLSGGISIKPSAAMDEMRADMGGAAAVVGSIQVSLQAPSLCN